MLDASANFRYLIDTFRHRKHLIFALVLIYFCITIDRFLLRLLTKTLIEYFVCGDKGKSYIDFVSLMISFAVALVSGLVTDKLFSRFWTVFAGYLLFLIGFLMLFFADLANVCGVRNETNILTHGQWEASCENNRSTGCWFLYLACLISSSVGFGFIWGNALTLGADQIKDINYVVIYFHGYLFFYQLGVTLSYYALKDHDVQKNPAFGLCLCLAAVVCLFLGKLVFQPEYTEHLEDPIFDAVTKAFGRVWFRKITVVFQNPVEANLQRQVSNDSGGLVPDDHMDSILRLFRLMLLFLCIIPFHISYNYQTELFQVQGSGMTMPKWNLNGDTIHVDADSFSRGLPQLLVLIFIPLFLILWFASSKRNWRFSFTRDTIRARLLGGLLCNATSVTLAGLLSSVNGDVYNNCIDNHDDIDRCVTVYNYQDDFFSATGVRIDWQIPQLMFSALSLTFVEITLLQLAYLEAPNTQHYRMNGKFISLFYLPAMIGVGIGRVYLHSMDSGFCNDDPSNGSCLVRDYNLAWFLYSLGGMQWVGVLAAWLALEDYFKWSQSGRGYLF